MAERGDDKVGTFSKGMQQRLGLGVALLGQPELVILDEPTSALDPLGRHDVREVIRKLRASGTTVFLNTHLLEEADQVCDRVCVIDHGRSIATGTLAELVGRASSVRLKVGAWGFDRLSHSHSITSGEVGVAIPQSLILFMFSFVVALSASAMASPAVSADVESGIRIRSSPVRCAGAKSCWANGSA